MYMYLGLALLYPHSLETAILQICYTAMKLHSNMDRQTNREFIESHYVPIKQSNPNFPILIRECSDIQPRVFARYEFGQESSSSLSNLSSEEVMKVVSKMATA
ncbi:NADH dehydrogenase [ubiquinone] 1 alpha subcomplex subunit 2-like isoform X1 [Ostrea edulis]|uniref:NADH dehydrogenase [ubiquinone] 1 alpha subcomplex subunit 2-like isoform X1 n=1 Tax=Ostrea edulis TaxID=37623 RepID=UPI0024AF6A7A|nr:NADH dehydrogenase [ubiquinone] 1 alpha subcomplex subunit 2-like isoform X1 [Ostrea edulis]